MITIRNNADILVLQLCKQKLNCNISTIIRDFWCVDMQTIQGLKMLASQPLRKALLNKIKNLNLYCDLLQPYSFVGVSSYGTYHIGIDHDDNDLQLQFMCCAHCGSYCIEYINVYKRGQTRIYCRCL